MKNIWQLAIIIMLALLLVACSNNKKEMNTVAETSNSDTEKKQEETGKTEANEEEINGEDEVKEDVKEAMIEEMVDYSNKKLIALTFDDGPNLTITPQVLDILEKYSIPASFFLIGNKVSESTKPVMERMLELGCEINNHSWSHIAMNTLTEDEIKEEIQKTNDIIVEMVGVQPAFFRPPYISWNNTMYENIDLPFICGILANDWVATQTAKMRTEAILNSVKEGDIILLHDFEGNTQTVEALDDIITGLLDQDYAFVTVSQLFELKGIDPNVEYHMWTNVNP